MKSVIIAAVCLFASSLYASERTYLTLTGANQGWIKGDSATISLNRIDTIEVVAYEQMLVMEADEKSGQAGTVRDHFPVTIIKPLDKSTPKLFEAWRTGEELEAVFRFYRPDNEGATQLYYTVMLRGAKISGLRREQFNNQITANSSLPVLERVSFTYGDIRETWEPTAVSSGDEWHANVSKPAMSDLNFDGRVNFQDYAILADEWLTQGI